MATRKNTALAAAPVYRLMLTSFQPERKVTVIKVIREITGLGLKEAKDLVEGVPSLVQQFETEADADAGHEALLKALEPIGAVCELEFVHSTNDDDRAARATITPRKIAPATAIALEQLRQRLFRAMSFVHTTRMALEEALYCERDTLFAAFKIIDEVAGELNNISGHNGPLPPHEDEGGVS